MRQIKKGKEPKVVSVCRTTPNSNYGSLEKQPVREALVAEQRGLCCYCMSRIKPTHDRMKIDHFASQSKNDGKQEKTESRKKTKPSEDLTLIYGNMLGACRGNDRKGVPEKEHHCDTFKKARKLSFHPCNPDLDIATLIEYSTDGTITSTDERLEKELNNVLNLNLPFLKNYRKATLSAFKATLKKDGKIPKATWQRHLRKFRGENSDAPLKPYCEVVAFWLQKKLRSMA